jgi:hypothetical protein
MNSYRITGCALCLASAGLVAIVVAVVLAVLR